MKIRHIAMVLAVLSLTACQNQPSQLGKREGPDVAALTTPCDNPKITEHCAKVLVVKNQSGKNVITVNPDPIVLTGHRNFHWFLWTIDDSQSSTPGKYTFDGVGVSSTSLQFYGCFRPIRVGNRYYVCYDYNNNPEQITYEVKLLDAAGNSAPVDPQVFNDG